MNFLNQIKEFMLDILMPRFCLNCGREGSYICDKCKLFLGEVENNIPEVFSCWEYEGIVKKALSKIKSEGNNQVARELIEIAFEKFEFNISNDIWITYIPIFKKDQENSEFNSAKIIAHQLNENFVKEIKQSLIVKSLLKKIKDKNQTGLNLKERKENVKGIFKFVPCGRIPEKVLLVDDICVTGATIEEGIRVLKETGVKEVWGFTLARKLRI
jgi:competence protein ComFC